MHFAEGSVARNRPARRRVAASDSQRPLGKMVEVVRAGRWDVGAAGRARNFNRRGECVVYLRARSDRCVQHSVSGGLMSTARCTTIPMFCVLC
eukprot:5806257-Prymnesium_polylepis.1